jgi:hypothetical protein
MATTAAKLFRGTATTAGATAYSSVPAGGQTIVTNIVAANKTATVATLTIQFGTGGYNSGTALNFCNGLQIPANGTVNFDIRQVMTGSDAIYVAASTNSTIDVMVSGVEITA